jgi:hypothetical protein
MVPRQCEQHTTSCRADLGARSSFLWHSGGKEPSALAGGMSNLPCPPRDQSWPPLPNHSVVDQHYCGGQPYSIATLSFLHAALTAASAGLSR